VSRQIGVNGRSMDTDGWKKDTDSRNSYPDSRFGLLPKFNGNLLVRRYSSGKKITQSVVFTRVANRQTDRQTNKQTDKYRVKHYLLGGSNYGYIITEMQCIKIGVPNIV